MAIILDKACCDAADFASRDSTRGNLTAVHVDPGTRRVSATDGTVLVSLPLPVMHPLPEEIYGTTPGLPVLVSAETLAASAKRAPKKPKTPGAGCVALVQDGKGVVLTSWDKDTRRAEMRDRIVEGSALDWRRVLPDEEPAVVVQVNPNKFLRLVEYAATHAEPIGGLRSMWLEVRGRRDPIVARFDVGEKREATAIVMPCVRPGSENVLGWAQQGGSGEAKARQDVERLTAEVARLEAVREEHEARIEKLQKSGREASAEAEKFATELLALKEAGAVGPIDADAIQELRERVEALEDLLDDARHAAGSEKAETVEATAQNTIDEIRRLKEHDDAIESLMEDHEIQPKKTGGFDLSIARLADQMRDYANAIDAVNDIRREEKKHEIDREGLAEVIGELVTEPDVDALDVAVAASELLDVIDNGRPEPWPLFPIREALRKYAAARDDVRMPSLKFD